MAPSKARCVAARGGRDGTITHQCPEDDFPLEWGEAVLDGLHHPVTNRKVLRLLPPAQRSDLVIRGAGETMQSPATAAGTGDGEL